MRLKHPKNLHFRKNPSDCRHVLLFSKRFVSKKKYTKMKDIFFPQIFMKSVKIISRKIRYIFGDYLINFPNNKMDFLLLTFKKSLVFYRTKHQKNVFGNQYFSVKIFNFTKNPSSFFFFFPFFFLFSYCLLFYFVLFFDQLEIENKEFKSKNYII